MYQHYEHGCETSTQGRGYQLLGNEGCNSPGQQQPHGEPAGKISPQFSESVLHTGGHLLTEGVMVGVIYRVASVPVATAVHRTTVVYFPFRYPFFFAQQAFSQASYGGCNKGDNGPCYSHDRIEESPRYRDGVHTRFRGGYEKSSRCSLACSLLAQGSGSGEYTARTERNGNTQEGGFNNGHHPPLAQVPDDVIGGQEHL